MRKEEIVGISGSLIMEANMEVEKIKIKALSEMCRRIMARRFSSEKGEGDVDSLDGTCSCSSSVCSGVVGHHFP